jgi:signal transduction histidine kinase/DNA-binding response OmpR family regulator
MRLTLLPSFSLRLSYICVGTGLSLATIFFAAYSIGSFHTASIRAAESDLGNMSVILAEQTARSVQAVDLILQELNRGIEAMNIQTPEQFRTMLSDKTTNDYLRGRLGNLPQLDALVINDAQGWLINSSRTWPVPALNNSKSDYLIRSAQSTERKVILSAPIDHKVVKAWMVYVALPVKAADGTHLGTISGAIKLSYFEEFYKAINLPNSSTIAVVRNDGTLLARYPVLPEATGSSLAKSAIVQQIMQGAEAVVGWTPGYIDRQPRIAAARAVRGYPMMVTVTETTQMILQEWRRQVVIVAGVTTSAIIAYGFLFATLVWHERRREKTAQELRESEARLAVAKDAAEASNRAKSEFLASMSHEIRTPMNGIIGMNHLLMTTPLSDQQYRYAETIRNSAESLLTIIDDILDVSKLEAGKTEIEAIAFDVDALTEGVVSILNPRAQEKGIELNAAIHPAACGCYIGDPTRLRQILLNLVGNAVKFTAKGMVNIDIALLAEKNDRHAVLRFDVSDTGIGIDETALASLFQDFIQADSSTTRKFGGTGLGLAISKRLVELMGGEIGVTSLPGHGSRFWFTVPLPRTDSAHVIAERDIPPAPSRPHRRLAILVAEDNKTNQQVAIAILSQAGHAVHVVETGREAVAAVERRPYDIILMDVQMPEMDGLQATARIRALPGPAGTIPIIALTAHAMTGARQAYIDAGMNDYISKPFHPPALLAKIDKLTSANEVATAAPLPETAVTRFDPSRLDMLKSAVDAADFPGLLHDFIEALEERVAKAMGLAKESKLAEAAREAHDIVSVAGNVGAVEASTLARDLETKCKSADQPASLIAATALEKAVDDVLIQIRDYQNRAA